MSNDKWQVEYVRATVFPYEDTILDASRLWTEQIQQEPDTINYQRDKDLDTREVEYKNGRIILLKRSNLIEWRYLAKPSDDRVSDGFALIGDLDTTLQEFLPFINTWLNSDDMFSSKRIAFGAVLLKPVEDLHAGYMLLKDYLPFLNIDNLSDFRYRLNRKRISQIVADLSLNCLRQWSVVELKSVNFNVNPNVEIRVQPNSYGFALRLELDINSPAEFDGNISNSVAPELFEELIGLGLELAEMGEKNEL